MFLVTPLLMGRRSAYLAMATLKSHDKSGCLRSVGRRIVPESRSSCTEGSVTEVGPRPSNEKRTTVGRPQSSAGAAVGARYDSDVWSFYFYLH